jgi:hypothetical protein
MSKKLIPWGQLKQQYFDSDIAELQHFISSTQALTPAQAQNGNFKQKTKGWRDEKAEYKSKIYSKVQEKIINNPKVHNQVSNLCIAMQNVEKKVAKLIGDPATQFTVDDLPKIKIGYEMLRLATGQSTINSNNKTSIEPITITEIVIN